ncbi:MAG: hypothetical protein KBT09_10130 [Bacteroidales bacterium]|nr:hypothetical protein [Candidatus Sodaliphilus fimicaballi]
MYKTIFSTIILLCLISCTGPHPLTQEDYDESIRKNLPFEVDSFYRLYNGYYAFDTKHEKHIPPQYILKGDGAFHLTTEYMISKLDLQSADEIWRDITVLPKDGRIICTDRIIKNGKYCGYVYVMQNDASPFGNYHWDVTLPSNMQFASRILDTFLDNTRDMLNEKTDTISAPASNNDYWKLIFICDTISNTNIIERILDKAFATPRYILPTHLTSFADKMEYSGNYSAAHRFMMHRISMEPDYYEDNCNFSKEIADTFAQRRNQYNYDLDLKRELEDILERDQHHRTKWLLACQERPQDNAKIERLAEMALFTDSINLVRIKEILNTHGYPEKKQVGELASIAAFLVIQHANLEEQISMLPAIKSATAMDIIPKSFLAMLLDRIELREGRPQKYGTQTDSSGNVTNLLDPTRVNEWRQEVGLPPITEQQSH